MIDDRYRFAVFAAVGLAVCCLVGWGTFVALRCVDEGTPKSRTARNKVFRRTLAENVRVTRQGFRGIDFVSCGVCRLEKRKKGFLTLGGMNVLVLEDLSVVIPPEEVGNYDKSDVTDGGGDTADIVRRLGVSDGFLAKRGMPVKFSGLRISRLTVSRLGTGGKPEMMFSASSAETVRGGLALKGCMVVQPTGETASVGKAMLTRTKKSLRLSWSGGEMDLT